MYSVWFSRGIVFLLISLHDGYFLIDELDGGFIVESALNLEVYDANA